MQHIHTLRVDLHRLSVDDPVVVAGGMGHDAIDLDLDNEWEGLSVVITIGPENRAVSIAYDGGPVTIPAECIDTPGMLPVSVTGYGEDGTVRVTTEQDCRIMRVVPSGVIEGEDAVPDAPDLLGQLVEAREDALGASEAAQEAAESAQGAAEDALKAAEEAHDAAHDAQVASRGTQVSITDGRPVIGGIEGDSAIDSKTGILYEFVDDGMSATE